MECHHFDMCVTIMETHNNNILVNLGVDQYATVITHIRKAILATDIATYLKVRGEYNKTIETNEFDWQTPRHRDLLRAMLMTASDLSAVIRPWNIQRRVAESVYLEFYQQGTCEREFGVEPDALYDESKVRVGCAPVYPHHCVRSL
jgi:hypothetical protein